MFPLSLELCKKYIYLYTAIKNHGNTYIFKNLTNIVKRFFSSNEVVFQAYEYRVYGKSVMKTPFTFACHHM